ncbi:hypothetical protein N332_10052, partial [Mesitornis unicolor]
DQWPLTLEKLQHLQVLINEQLLTGQVVPTTSPWNSPIFVIQKKSGKWYLLHDLRCINAVIIDMGPLQPGLPSPTIIPNDWYLTVIDLKDCFFTIPLDPNDAPKFAFSVPAVNVSEPSKQYHWTVLPQGMKNRPTICQWFTARAHTPTQEKLPHICIYHYTDDTLVATKTEIEMEQAMTIVLESIKKTNLEVAQEKVQRTSPWKNLRWKITNQQIIPQSLKLVSDIHTLNDLQKFLGTINWVRPLLRINNEGLHPLFQLLKGDSAL